MPLGGVQLNVTDVLPLDEVCVALASPQGVCAATRDCEEVMEPPEATIRKPLYVPPLSVTVGVRMESGG